ncbi:MAG: MMPL family transporter [Gammaproteobacteria bacterium]|nr:MMPL family transporter [Gammaproteobacteria bacterium]
MKIFLTKLSALFEAVPDTTRRYRWFIWAFFLVVLGAYGSGAAKFQLDLSDEGFFAKDDPVRVAYNQFRANFGSDDNIYILYKPTDGDVFSHQSLKAMRDLQEEILNYRLNLKEGETSPLDHILEIKSIVNASYLEASVDALISRQYVGSEIPTRQKDLDDLKTNALNHPDYPLMYISKDTQYGAFLIRTDLGTRPVNKGETEQAQPLNMEDMDLSELDITDMGSGVQAASKVADEHIEFEFIDPQEYVDLMHKLNETMEKPEYTKYMSFHPVGNAVVHTFVMDILFKQINVVMSLSLLLIIIMLWILFRSASAVLWPVVIICSASLLTIATLGWLGLRMNMMVNITVFMVLVVGVADAVHLLSGYIYFRNHGNDHHQSLRLAYRNAGTAIFLTSVTTAIGMLALFMVPIDAIQTFGFSAAVGVLFAFVISVFMLPVMLDVWRPYKKLKVAAGDMDSRKHHVIQKMLLRVEHLSHLKPSVNITIFTVLLGVFVFGLTKIEVDSNPMSLFDPETPIVADFELVDEKMGGTQAVEIMIDMGVENGLKDPVVLKAMERYQDYLVQTFPGEVLRTNSLVNIVKDSNKSLNGGREDYYRIPDEPRVVDQTLFLFNNANPKDRRLVVSDDYRKAHITASFTNVGSKRYVEVFEVIEPVVEEIFGPLRNTYPEMKITTTGGMTLFSKLLDLLSWSQIKGFGIALALISIVLLLVFSSIKMGLVAIYPNLFPLVVMFGLMGYLGIPLDVDTLIVAPLMIGIVVDDTIHFMNHYRAEIMKHGDVSKAIQVAFREVGQAITFTSLILALSFMAMIGLDHQGLKNFGILSSLTIITALIAELFLLPALLSKTNAGVELYSAKSNSQTAPAAA